MTFQSGDRQAGLTGGGGRSTNGAPDGVSFEAFALRGSVFVSHAPNMNKRREKSGRVRARLL